MPITVEIKLKSEGEGGMEIKFHSIPEGEVSQNEIDVANAIIAICDLIDDDDFNDHMHDIITKKIKLMQKFQDSISSDLVM